MCTSALCTQKPLGIVQSLIAAPNQPESESTVVQPKLIDSIDDFTWLDSDLDQNDNTPDSWDSIEELLGESEPPQTDWNLDQTIPSSSPPTIQRTIDPQFQNNDPISVRVPEVQPMQFAIDYAEFSDRDYSDTSSSDAPIQAKNYEFISKNSVNPETLGKVPGEVNYADNVLSAAVDEALDRTLPKEESINDANNLEVLAREIYGLLRQRLEIERERHGNHYSGRLPW
ncbi:hypothetical protein ACQ4M3_31935 [Leptolyngbya sp. AN03gr2]|uniref:hypothetical protein n=1 Tax=Leptolyngbya sp. AN03gr2 TaxID=3423364 RepID=UPI003D31B740